MTTLPLRFLAIACRRWLPLTVVMIAFVFAPSARAVEFVETDVCVYGGTSGGVTAAVQAARLGKTVALVVHNNHLGGMTSGGLGATDTGNTTSIQGLAREFYIRVNKKYNASATSPTYAFEPKVAEAVFNEMAAAEAPNLAVYYNQRLADAEMNGARLRTITMENGNVFRAKMFIDCSYEGDLMALAGVSYTVGREPNSQYGETLSGVQVGRSGSHQIRTGVNPYKVPGVPASGLLPQVNADPIPADGAGDSRVQAYCYRLCLTNAAANRVMIPQPPGYNEADFELLLRSIEVEYAANFNYTGPFFSTAGMPHSKTDSNNNGGVSFDFIGGGSDDWAEASFTEREAIAAAHEYWQRGLIWTLQNHPRVPASVRAGWLQWGLPLDEFPDTGHWPHQLYVREARRMVSAYVMTQKNCQGAALAQDSVGLASYTMDSHNVQRHVRGGVVKNEGDVQVGVPQPYPISYRSIIPHEAECENLLVTFALSASHMGFGSCRMEPVLMMTSQSAGAAACLAIDDDVNLQDLPYPKLRAQLLAQGQMLTWGSTAGPGLIVDNSDSTGVILTGAWTASSATGGYYGSNYLHDDNAGQGTKSVTFRPNFPAAGQYEVFLRWTEHSNRATNAPVAITHSGGTFNTTVNQQANGGAWVSLGSYDFPAGSSAAGQLVISNTDANGYVIADAAQFVSASEDVVVSLWAANGSAAEPLGASRPARAGKVMVSRTGSTIGALTVNLALGGSAQPGTDYSGAPAGGSVVIPAGATTASLTFTPLADLLAEGSETITVSLAPGAYSGSADLPAAVVNIADRPFDAWRRARFSEPELANAAISGDDADPDADGYRTLEEFLADGEPLAPQALPPPELSRVSTGGQDYLTYTFERRKAADILAIPEVSGNLDAWQSGPAAVEEQVIADNGVVQTIRARDRSPLGHERYFRLRQERVP